MSSRKTAIFIDTNIYLFFYSFSKSDLKQLKELSSNLSQGKFSLYVPSNVKDEFYRKREKTIDEALKKLNEINFNLKIPTLCKNIIDKYNTLVECKKSYVKAHNELFNSIKQQAIENTLEADLLIKSIFESANCIESNENIIHKAHMRSMLGNPPGKKNSICDAVNWGSSLDSVESNLDMIIISRDSDYRDELDKNRIRPFLQNEWKDQKNSEVILFEDLNIFFKKRLPILELKDQVDENINNLISDLETSPTFAYTHSIINKLSPYIDKLDDNQSNKIVEIYLNNNQVNWILGDQDVKTFIQDVLIKSQNISLKNKEKLNQQLQIMQNV